MRRAGNAIPSGNTKPLLRGGIFQGPQVHGRTLLLVTFWQTFFSSVQLDFWRALLGNDLRSFIVIAICSLLEPES